MEDISSNEALAMALIKSGVGTDPISNSEWPIYVGHIPQNAPPNALGVYDTSGIMDGRLMRTGETISHPGAQIKFRCESETLGKAKIKQAQKALDSIFRLDILDGSRGVCLVCVSQRGTPLAWGLDGDTQLRTWTLNVTLTLSEK